MDSIEVQKIIDSTYLESGAIHTAKGLYTMSFAQGVKWQKSIMVKEAIDIVEKEVIKIWRNGPDGEYGAWQYSFGNFQGGGKTLIDAINSIKSKGMAILILPDGESAPVAEEKEPS